MCGLLYASYYRPRPTTLRRPLLPSGSPAPRGIGCGLCILSGSGVGSGFGSVLRSRNHVPVPALHPTRTPHTRRTLASPSALSLNPLRPHPSPPAFPASPRSPLLPARLPIASTLISSNAPRITLCGLTPRSSVHFFSGGFRVPRTPFHKVGI